MGKFLLATIFTFCCLFGTANSNCTNHNCQNGADCLTINDFYNCNNNATCLALNAGYNWGYVCVCPAGFSGAQCQWDNVNSCSSQTSTRCLNGGQCFANNPGDRVCVCPNSSLQNFTYGGHYCEKVNLCSSCPSNITQRCVSVPTIKSGRICLNTNGEIIFNSQNQYA